MPLQYQKLEKNLPTLQKSFSGYVFITVACLIPYVFDKYRLN